MADIIRPDRTARSILRTEASGTKPANVSLVAPTIVAPGEQLVLKVAVADKIGYPSVECDDTLAIRCASATPECTEVTFSGGEPAVAHVRGVTIAEDGFHRFETILDGNTFYSNPVLCTTEPKHRIYWGDPHVHTVLSDCMTKSCRSLPFCYVAARWFAGLDFVSAADHVSNGRCTLGKWLEQRMLCDAYDDPPQFAALHGFEVSLKGDAGGDNNVYFLGELPIFVDEYEEGSTKTLSEKLAEVLPRSDFMVVPHHTTRTGKHGEIPPEIYAGADVTPIAEIHSKWGTSEYRGNPNPLKKVHPGPSYVVDLLNQGYPLGFIGGTDTHSTMPAGFGDDHLDSFPGMTAVMTEELSRENVFRAIKTRNCYATSLERVYLDVTVAGATMGQQVPWKDASEPREIHVNAAGASDIETIDLVRNGQTIRTERGDGWNTTVTFTDDEDLSPLMLSSPHIGDFVYYYVRASCASGARAWSSPVWLAR